MNDSVGLCTSEKWTFLLYESKPGGTRLPKKSGGLTSKKKQ